MTENSVLKIIEKAFGDEDLRCRLMTDLSGTLDKMGEKLSAQQMQELVRELNESGESFASGLDQRLSHSGVSLSPRALLQQSKRKIGQRKGALEMSEIGNTRSPIASRRPKKKKNRWNLKMLTAGLKIITLPKTATSPITRWKGIKQFPRRP